MLKEKKAEELEGQLFSTPLHPHFLEVSTILLGWVELTFCYLKTIILHSNSIFFYFLMYLAILLIRSTNMPMFIRLIRGYKYICQCFYLMNFEFLILINYCITIPSAWLLIHKYFHCSGSRMKWKMRMMWGPLSRISGISGMPSWGWVLTRWLTTIVEAANHSLMSR